MEESDEEEIEDDHDQETTSLITTSTHFNKEQIFEQGLVLGNLGLKLTHEHI